MSEKIVNFDELTPVNFLKRTASIYPNKTAIVYNDRRYNYTEFQTRVNRLANALVKVGVKQGDKVAFICPNTPPMLEAHFAVPMIGAALVTINIRLASHEIAYIVNHSDSKVFFVDNEFAGLVKPVLDKLTQVKTFVNICDVNDETPLDGLIRTCI